jgi:hypothetical protein
MKKREYINPEMTVIELKQQSILCASGNGGAQGVSNGDGIGWQKDGFGGDDCDV